VSIVSLRKVTIIGHDADKEGVLRDLQDFGCLHLLPLRLTPETQKGSPHSRAYDALHFLLSCPRRRRQVTREEGFDAVEVERRALQVRDRLLDLDDEADALRQRIADLAPWGGFTFPPLEEMAGQRFWFYIVPDKDLPAVEALGLRWQIVRREGGLNYLVVIAAEEPEVMPVPREHLGSRSREELERRLEDVEVKIDEFTAERTNLSRWAMLFARRLDGLEDREDRERAAGGTLDDGPLFGLEAWAPAEKIPELKRYAGEKGVVFEAREPEPSEAPPTLLENRPELRAGEGLVTFYTIPGYGTWDPSPVVLFSFAVFFAMIISDAGYGLLLGGILGLLWKRLEQSDGGRRFRTLLFLLTVCSLAYGAIVGSYFGLAPPAGSLLSRVSMLDVNDSNAMMSLSVVIGVLHLVTANVMNARRFGWRTESLPPLGWASMILGGLLAAAASQTGQDLLWMVSLFMLAAGALLVLLFSGTGKRPLGRAVSGLLALTKVTSAFGDALSYLRLFALGLASASLAVAFNDMAGQVRQAVPGAGLLLALTILLLGHGLNFVLSLSSAVIHGLRLNVIEFFNWGLTEEGNLFRPFRRKEHAQWNL
jgi:V/A-type H+-transporting ATPase subunit I